MLTILSAAMDAALPGSDRLAPFRLSSAQLSDTVRVYIDGTPRGVYVPLQPASHAPQSMFNLGVRLSITVVHLRSVGKLTTFTRWYFPDGELAPIPAADLGPETIEADAGALAAKIFRDVADRMEAGNV